MQQVNTLRVIKKWWPEWDSNPHAFAQRSELCVPACYTNRSRAIFMVRRDGLEPPELFQHRIYSPARYQLRFTDADPFISYTFRLPMQWQPLRGSNSLHEIESLISCH